MLRVKELAEKRGWNITELANQAHMAYSMVHGLWTNKTKRPALSTLEHIAKTLDVPVWALFADAPLPKKDKQKSEQKI